jgi:hypothetical protein
MVKETVLLHLKMSLATFSAVVVAATLLVLFRGHAHFAMQYYRGVAGHCFECDEQVLFAPDWYMWVTRTNETVYAHVVGLRMRKRYISDPLDDVNHVLDVINATRAERSKLDPHTLWEKFVVACGDFSIMLFNLSWLFLRVVLLALYFAFHRVYLGIAFGVALLSFVLGA